MSALPSNRAALALLALGSSLALGCAPQAATHSPADPSSSAAAVPAALALIPAGAPVHFATKGVPHSSPISLIALAPSGDAALTRDSAGGVRLWLALDGSREPLIVPIRDPRSMALAAREGGGATLSLVDPAGGVRLIDVDAQGRMQKLGSLSPTDPIAETLVLPGGERLLAVGQDHVLRLLRRDGAELARLDEPGLRISSLRLATAAADGPRLIALTAGEFDGSEGRFAVEAFTLTLGETTLARGPHSQTLFLDAATTPDNPSVSPDGRALVYVERKRHTPTSWSVVAKQLEDGRQVSVEVPLTTGVQPRLGLLAGGRALLDEGSGLGFLVDLGRGTIKQRPLRSSPTLNHSGSSFRPGLRVSAANTWLAVHELERDELVYLGYDQISVTDVGVSPNGQVAAWALGDRVAIERDAKVVEVPDTRNQGYRFVEFLDDEHLLMLHWNGGLELVDARSGERVYATDLGSDVQSAELSRDGRGGAAMLVRTALWQYPTLVQLDASAILDRFLVNAPSNFAGLLTPPDGPRDAWGAWTLDATAQLHQYSFAQLRAGIDPTLTPTPGEVLPLGMPEHMKISATGTRYWVSSVNSRPSLHVERGAEAKELALDGGPIVMIAPSRDDARLAVIQQRELSQLLTIYSSEDLRVLWAQPVPPINGLSWSEGGESLGLAASLGGGVVFDTTRGQPITARCGARFELRHAPPISQGAFNQISVCEL